MKDPKLSPRDPGFEIRVRDSFARQAFMATLGASLGSVAPGRVVITLPFRGDLVQQHGFLHAGVLTAITDSACGYAAFSLMAPDTAVLSVEFKVNLLAPAAGDTFEAEGTVLKSGRTLSVCRGDAWAVKENRRTLVLAMQATMATLPARDGLAD